jgi:hypothetical protein
MLCNRFFYLSEFEFKLRNINTCAVLSSMRHTSFALSCCHVRVANSARL